MFKFFQSKDDRAIEEVAAFLRQNFAASGFLPLAALSDRYCLGFLQIVGAHVAARSLPKGSGMDAAKSVFVQALHRVVPSAALDVTESLSVIRNDERFLRGTKDGDLYMGALSYLAPKQDGEAAFQRYTDQVREITSLQKVQPNTARPSATPGNERSDSGGTVRWTNWTAEDKTEGFEGPARQVVSRTYTFSGMRAAQGSASLKIECLLEAAATPDGEGVNMERQLRFHLHPFRLPHDADFILRFITRDGAQGGEFDVVAGPEGEGGALIARYRGRNDVATCVAALRTGRDLIFQLRDEREGLVDFLLPSDGEFERVYDETIKKLQQRAVLNQLLAYNAELQRGRVPQPDPETSTLGAEGWQIEGSGHEYMLSRIYSSSEATVRIICTVKSSPEVNFVVTDLRIQFKPLALRQDGPLVLGLFTDEPKGALVEVEALAVSAENRSRLLDVVMLVHREDTHKLLRALGSGDDLHFAIMNAAPPEEEPVVGNPIDCLARFVLENDNEFKDIYDETVEKVAACQDATRTRQLGENWYRRRSPGLHAG